MGREGNGEQSRASSSIDQEISKAKKHRLSAEERMATNGPGQLHIV
jgi:hypothetical protein